MTTIKSVMSKQDAHGPPQCAADVRRLLETCVALLGAEEATLRIYDENDHAQSTLGHPPATRTGGHISNVLSWPVGSAGFQTVQRIEGADVSFNSDCQSVVSFCGPIAESAVHSRRLVGSSGHPVGVLTARFAHSHCLSAAELRAFEFSAEALGIVISSCQREKQARISGCEVRERNTELENLNTRLVRSNEDLERFAIAASHDLKEPLRTITGYAQLLSRTQRSQMDEVDAGLVNGIIESTERMSALLCDLLTYAEIGVTETEDTPRAADLNAVVEKAIRNVGISAAESGASITADSLPTVVAPEIYLLELFQNLISNAIKYRSDLPPKIHITSSSKAGAVEFIVSDNGMGIDPQYHARIFEPFRRLGSNKSSGTGMGLTICQRIVQKFGGRIWVESPNQGGAAFHFTLPNAAVVPTAVTRSSPEYASGRIPTVLLIEDNPADVDLFRLALNGSALEWKLTVIDDGAVALNYLRQATAGEVPDAMLLDLHLPKCGGIEILEAMAASSMLSSVPAVVWSSVLSSRDSEALKRFDFVTYMRKPTMVDDYLKVGHAVNELLVKSQSSRDGGISNTLSTSH